MRILLINWARIVDGALVGGGVNGYCQGLALELAGRGHRVSYLSSGVTYTRPLDPSAAPTIRRLDDYCRSGERPIRVFDVIDSPVVAPAIFQFNHPDLEAAAPSLERAFATFIDEQAFDIIHFHNIEGLSAGCIDAARIASSRPRILFSLHNYHTICPQVYLMQSLPDSSASSTPLRAACRDFRNGHACVECERTHDPAAEVARRIGIAEPPRSPSGHSPRIPQHTPVDLTLDNQILPEPSSNLLSNAYAQRRSVMISALSRCHAVLAVSSFVRRKFAVLGVDPRVIHELPIGTRMVEMASQHRASETAPRPPRFADAPSRPIRLAFLGYHNYYKGLHVLVEALEMLDAAVASRLSLGVYAKDVAPIQPRLEALRPKLAGLQIEPGYAYARIPSILSDKDVLVVPSVWWDNGPQTVMEAIACHVPILASEIGGIPDLVENDRTALLYRAGDVQALASRLNAVVRQPTVLDSLRENIAVRAASLTSMDQHATQLESVYADLLAARASANLEAINA